MCHLRDLGNTVIVVEQMKIPCWLRPHHELSGAGVHGGNVVFNGKVADILKSEDLSQVSI
ncbi:MAG: hypothetical protein ACLRX7_10010 [Acutalibacteraceae bacterium]